MHRNSTFRAQSTNLIKVNDTGLRILLLSVPGTMFVYDFFTAPGGTGKTSLIYLLTLVLVCEGARFLIYNSRRWFSGPKKKRLRLATLLPAGIAWVTLVFMGSKLWRNYIALEPVPITTSNGFTLHINDEKVQLGLVGASLLYAVLAFMVLFWIYELAYHFARLRHSEQVNDRLEKEKLHAELQQLKGIVNPHFLFNNLNSLSALISESPAQAEEFLNELTKVFRYLLRNNETDLTTLEQELQFLDSYFHLLQTRYGAAIELDLSIDPDCRSLQLPPLTLQLLVENAVKHNRLLKTAPLRIEVFSEGGSRLVVRNNLSAREQASESTGIGLRNIRSRYTLLGEQGPVIHKDAHHFSVAIPLIRPSEAIVPEKMAAAF